MKNGSHADRKSMTRMRFLLIVMLIAFGAVPISAAVPKFGYSVSTRGFSSDSAPYLPFEYAGMEFVWRPGGADSRTVISAGAAVPVKKGWFADAAVSISADAVVYRSAPGEHMLADFLSLDSRFAPAAGIGGTAAVRDFSGVGDIWIQGELQPLRFETGGGYASLLATAVLVNPYGISRSGIFGDPEDSAETAEPAAWFEWGVILFEYGFFVW